jgi:hypothetical protein
VIDQHPTLLAVLGKLKVGGLVLLATLVLAGTAEAATGSSLFSDEGGTDTVTLDSTDCPTEEPVPDPSTDTSGEPTPDVSDAPTVGEVTPEPSDTAATPAPSDTAEPSDTAGPSDCESPTADPSDSPTDVVTDDPTDDSGTTDDETDAPTDGGAGSIACEDAANHGQYVSSVAHSVPPGPGHGAAVSEAAKSDCGKKKAEDAGDQSDGDTSADTSSDDTTEGTNTGGASNGHSDGWVPPGQAKKAEASGTTSAPGNSGNAPGHNK